MTVAAISAIEAVALPNPLTAPAAAAPAAGGSFSQLLAGGIDGVSDKVTNADAMVRAFTLDDSIPVHQVTYALAQAQLSLDLMVHVRDRLIDGYQQLMNMQL